MTDREMVMQLIKKLGNSKIVLNTPTYLEVENSCVGEDIIFEFTEEGKIIDLYC